jgi:hypothetical protein
VLVPEVGEPLRRIDAPLLRQERTQLRQSLIDAAIGHGGSFPVSCTPEATRAQVESCYPQLRAFLAEKRRIDPAERLTNFWYQHHRKLFSPACEVRWAR